jgi:hypothetical protein
MMKNILIWLALLAPGLVLAQPANTYVPGPSPYAPSGTPSNGQCLVWSSTAGPNSSGAWINAACGGGSGITALTGVVTGTGPGSTPTSFGSGATAALPAGALPSGVTTTAGGVPTGNADTATLTNKTQSYANNTFIGFGQMIPCTGTFATDTALLAAATAIGGNITLTGNCVVNATTVINSSTLLNGNGFKITAAAAANWSGSVIRAAFNAADGATNVTIENTTWDWTGAPASTHILNFDDPPATFSKISILNNTALVAPGDFVALVNVTDATITGNKVGDATHGCAGACFDLWGIDTNVVETGNSASVASEGIGYIYTGFFDSSHPSNATNINISHNFAYLIDSSGGVPIGIYIQGYETSCSFGTTNDAYNTVADNQIVLTAGVNGRPIWVNSCAYYTDVHDNIITGDNVTAQTAPAIEVNGLSGASIGIQIHDNIGYGFLAPTTGSDAGDFVNKGSNGSIINNTCFSCGALLVGTTGVQSSTRIYGNDNGTGIDTFVTPATFSAAAILNGPTSGTGLDAYALAYLAGGHPVAASTLSSTSAPTVNGVAAPVNLFSWGIPVGIPPSGFFANNGVYIVGQAPASSATVTFGATSGSTSMTFSAGTPFANGAADIGRVLTVLDTVSVTATSASPAVFTGDTLPNGTIITNIGGTPPTGFSAGTFYYVVNTSGNTFQLSATPGGTAINSSSTGTSVTVASYKFGTCTAAVSTTVCTATISGGTLSTAGAWANNVIWLSGSPTTNISAFSVPLPAAVLAHVYFNLPVNVISAATAAGIYNATCATSTFCIVTNNALASGLPTIPGSPTIFATTGTGAFSQSTSALNILTLSIPANSLGANGSLVSDIFANRDSNANTVALQTFYGGVQTAQFSVVSVVWYGTHRTIRNLGATNSQVLYCATCVGAMTDATTNNNTSSTLTVDSTQAQNFVVKGASTTAATDWIFTLGGTIQANYAP